MKEIGDRMKARREAARLTLRDIERQTKISIRLLEHMEAGRFDQLPKGVFARNFIRQYCAIVGMDADEVLRELAPEPEEAEDTKATGRPSDTRWVLPVFGLVLVLMIGGWLGYRWWRSRPPVPGQLEKRDVPVTNPSSPAGAHADRPEPDDEKRTEAPQAVVSASDIQEKSSEPARKPTGTTVSGSEAVDASAQQIPLPAPEATVSQDTVSEESSSVELVFEVTDRCWIHLTCPDRDMDFILEAGERYTVRCDEPIRVTLGNTPAVRLTVNGRPVRLPGDEKVLRDFVVVPDLE